jgi:uracil-DNA glycosylase family 4
MNRSIPEKEQKLKNLQRRMTRCDLPLKESCRCLVFGKGDPGARIFFVGQAPGRQEDACGEPFVGAAGRILDELFECAGLTRREVYITSILKYFPPRNRPPRLEEIRAHTPFLVEQVRIVQPRIIAAMGNFATRFVLAGFNVERMAEVPMITSLHGQVQDLEFEGSRFTVLPLFHPAAALYFPPLKKKMRQDFRRLRDLKGH